MKLPQQVGPIVSYVNSSARPVPMAGVKPSQCTCGAFMPLLNNCPPGTAPQCHGPVGNQCRCTAWPAVNMPGNPGGPPLIGIHR
jgi:hypothetical protein